MSKLIDLTGQKFGWLTVIERAEDYITPAGRRLVAWKCRCECGNIISALSSNLTSGNTSSCGCITHGHAWNMKNLIGNRFGKLLVIKLVETYITPKGKKAAK